VNGEEFTGSTESIPGVEATAPPDVTMPLGTGELPDEPATLDPLAGTGTKKKLGGGSLLIVAVVLIAVGGLFSMRKLAQATAAAGTNSEIETTIESFLRSLAGQPASIGPTGGSVLPEGHERALTVLTTEYSERQVPLRCVQRNPFIIFQPTAVAPVKPEEVQQQATQQEMRWRQMREQRQALIRQEGAKLTLKSILGGSTPLAIINGRIVRVGEAVPTQCAEVTFRVLSIESGSVDLIAEAPELDLKIKITLELQRDR